MVRGKFLTVAGHGGDSRPPKMAEALSGMDHHWRDMILWDVMMPRGWMGGLSFRVLRQGPKAQGTWAGGSGGLAMEIADVAGAPAPLALANLPKNPSDSLVTISMKTVHRNAFGNTGRSQGQNVEEVSPEKLK